VAYRWHKDKATRTQLLQSGRLAADKGRYLAFEDMRHGGHTGRHMGKSLMLGVDGCQAGGCSEHKTFHELILVDIDNSVNC
jgi:hypothetical protein